MGVVFHGLPTRDPQRCRTWLKAIQNPRLDENTPVSKYSGVRVCSLHFTPEDYEEDFRAKILNVAPKLMLKSGAVPSVFPGRPRGEPGGSEASAPPPKRSRTQVRRPVLQLRLPPLPLFASLSTHCLNMTPCNDAGLDPHTGAVSLSPSHRGPLRGLCGASAGPLRGPSAPAGALVVDPFFQKNNKS